jgi:hypothetical protein
MTGDISGANLGMPDGKVDISDIAQVAIRFGKYAEDLGYHAVCDIYYDGKIDIADIAIVAIQFGKIDP